MNADPIPPDAGTFAGRFRVAVQTQLDRVVSEQADAIETAAGWVVEAFRGGGFWYVFGTGHSHLLALEGFYRAGGLARVVPMLDSGLMLHGSASGSTARERTAGLGSELLDRYRVNPADLLTIVSNSGRNTVPVEMAMEAGARGVRVVALTNLRHSRCWPSRHPSGRRLEEVASLVLDNGGVPGDAAVEAWAGGAWMGPTSTLTGAFLVQAIAGRAAEMAAASGAPLEVYQSSNGPGEAANERLLARYRGHIPHL